MASVYENFCENYYSQFAIHKMKHGKDILKDPNTGSCVYDVATSNHYVVLVGKNDLCEYLAVRLITKSSGYDNKPLSYDKIEGQSAQNWFKGKEQYISSDTFYIESSSIEKYGIGFYKLI